MSNCRSGLRAKAGQSVAKIREKKKSSAPLARSSHIATFQLSPNDGTTLRVHAMNLKDRLCDVEADGCDCLHDELLRIVVARIGNQFRGVCAPRGRSRPQHQYRARQLEDRDPRNLPCHPPPLCAARAGRVPVAFQPPRRHGRDARQAPRCGGPARAETLR